jgi:O-antigen/teichoic acid export membrane protein
VDPQVELAKIGEESARGGLSLMVGTATSAIIGAVGVIVMARLLGPTSYGLYTLALVVPALFVSIADLGVSPSLTRYAASLRSDRKYARLAGLLGSGVTVNLIAGSIALILGFAFSGQLATLVLQRQDIGQLVALASLMILFQGFFNLSYNTFIGLDRMERSALMGILRDVTRVTLSTVLIILGFGLAGAIIGQVSAWMLTGLFAVLLLLVFRRGLGTMSSTPDIGTLQEDARTMMAYGLPLYVGSLMTTVLAQYQNIVLAFFTTNAEIGNLSAAVNFGALVSVVATPVAASLFPAFSKVDLQTRRDDLKRMFELSVKYVTILVLPIAILVAAVSEDLTGAVFGRAYSYASTYLALYMCLFLLTGVGYYVIGNFLNGIGKTKETLKITLIQLGVFLPAAPLMASLWRVPGLIAAMVLSALVSTSFGLRIATGRYGMQLDLRNSLRTLGAALTSTLPVLPIVYYSPLPSLANVLLGGSVYLAAYLTLVPLFRAIKRSDIRILAPILGQIRTIKPVTDRILAYETWLLEAVEGNTKIT